MKKLVLIFLMATFTLVTNAQSMKMVVTTSGEVVGRYVRTEGNHYVACMQDDCDVPKKGHKVVTFSAANGQGIVYYNQSRHGNINIRKYPSTKAPIVAIWKEPVCMPDTYPCLGKVNGWYKTRVNGKIGYVRADMAEWDGMATF